MGWSIGFDEHWQRDIGYSIPAHCDHPGCRRVINRGLAYVCGGNPYGEPDGCGLYFCEKHLHWRSKKNPQACARCVKYRPPFKPKPDHKKWTHFKMHDWSWAEWRKENGYPEPKRMRKPTVEEIGFEIVGTGYTSKSS